MSRDDTGEQVSYKKILTSDVGGISNIRNRAEVLKFCICERGEDSFGMMVI